MQTREAAIEIINWKNLDVHYEFLVIFPVFRRAQSLSKLKPDFLNFFGETEDNIDDWPHPNDIRIEDLIIRASK